MSLSGVRRWAWVTLWYIVFVILWGAFVRATGSGAGCGDHWPLCNGVVVPREPRLETLIELTHRLTSGLSLVFVVGLFFAARRVVPAGHGLRRAAGWSVVFIILEALIGAGLVLFELVAHNASLTRMISMSAHLLNTFALLTCLCLCLWRAAEIHEQASHSQSFFAQLRASRLTMTCGILLLLSGMSGAIAALGDTLYSGFGSLPLEAYMDANIPSLVRLRLIHPIIAVLTAVVILIHQAKSLSSLRDRSSLVLGWTVSILTLSQLALGFVNVQLMAPVWMQILHLFVGVSLWISFSFFAFRVSSK